MKIENQLYLTRCSTISISLDKLIKLLSRNNDNNSKISNYTDANIFYDKQLRNPNDFHKVKSFNEIGLVTHSFLIISLDPDLISSHIIKNAKDSYHSGLMSLEKQKEKIDQNYSDKKSFVYQSICKLIEKFEQITKISDPKKVKEELLVFESDRKNLEIVNELNNLRNTTEIERKLISNCLHILKTISYEYKLVFIYKKVSVDSCYLTLGRHKIYNLTFSSHNSFSCDDSEVGDYNQKSSFCNQVSKETKKTFGILDNMSSLYKYVKLNEFFNLEKEYFLLLKNNSNNTNSDIYRFCFTKYQISYKSINSSLALKQTGNLQNLRFFFNLYTSHIAYYRSYCIDVLYDDLISRKNITNLSQLSLNNLDKDEHIVKNHENNECTNFFIDGTTYIYAVSQAFNQDLIAEEENIKTSYSYLKKKDIINENYEDYKKKMLILKINNHEYRYYASELGLTILSNIIYYSMCNRAYFECQINVEKIERIKLKTIRLFSIHEAEKEFANIESIYKPNSIYSKSDKENISRIVAESMHTNAKLHLNNDITKDFWQEANTSNGKYSAIISLFSLLLSIISLVVSGIISVLCFINFHFFDSDTIIQIISIIFFILLAALLAGFSLKHKK